MEEQNNYLALNKSGQSFRFLTKEEVVDPNTGNYLSPWTSTMLQVCGEKVDFGKIQDITKRGFRYPVAGIPFSFRWSSIIPIGDLFYEAY